MDLARPGNSKKLITLQEAAQRLAVSIPVLLEWNEYNILKPTITSTGEIGYTQEQIEGFLAIQNLSQNNNPGLSNTNTPVQPSFTQTVQATDKPLPTQVQTTIPQSTVNPAKTYAQQDFAKSLHSRNNKSLLFMSVSSFAVIVILAVVFTQQDNLKLLLDSISQQATNTGAVLGLKSNDFSLSDSSTQDRPVQIKNKTSQDNHLSDEDVTGQKNKVAISNTIFDRITASTAGTSYKQTAYATTAGNVNTYTETANLPQTNKNTNSVFDDNGNIKGQTVSKDLFAALGTASMIQTDNSLKPANSINIMLAFLGLGAISFMYLFKKQPAYSTKRKTIAHTSTPHFSDKIESERILEVTQKTDGTVVLYFQGKEYKVSKPELNSESDQFIGRLMELAKGDVKEIDYDTLSDEKLRFYTPLSKLVTRLGFVGLKRDLFFPRTSKNMVLFRRYITKEDLIAMNVTADQISSNFLNNS